MILKNKKRLRSNLLALLLGSLTSITLFMLFSLGSSDIIIISGLVVPLFGGIVCGLLIHKKDHKKDGKSIGLSFILIVVVIVVLLSKFFFPAWVGMYMFGQGGLSVFYFGVIIVLTLVGISISYLPRTHKRSSFDEILETKEK